VFNNVESDGLGKRSALADGNDITFTDVSESRGTVDRHVSVLLGKTTILGEVLKIISSNNQSSLHLVGDNHCLQDSTTNRHIASEGALLVNVVSFDGSLGSLEAETDTLVESHALEINEIIPSITKSLNQNNK